MDRRRNRRQKKPDTVSLGQLAASVAYHYHLAPEQIAKMSGPQLLLWHERKGVELGYAKLLDLEVSLVPHTEHPDRAVREIREALLRMTET